MGQLKRIKQISEKIRMKNRSHANKYLRKIKVNIQKKKGICISTISNADVVCYSCTWHTELNDVNRSQKFITKIILNKLNVDGNRLRMLSPMDARTQRRTDNPKIYCLRSIYWKSGCIKSFSITHKNVI